MRHVEEYEIPGHALSGDFEVKHQETSARISLCRYGRLIDAEINGVRLRGDLHAFGLFEQGVALADLAVDSPLTTKLNKLDAPSNVPYLVLAGENKQNPAERNRVKRFAAKILDAGLDELFGEDNDIAIGLSSMQGLRGGAYPRLTTETLPCDHFHYYVTPEGQQAIKEWAAW